MYHKDGGRAWSCVKDQPGVAGLRSRAMAASSTSWRLPGREGDGRVNPRAGVQIPPHGPAHGESRSVTSGEHNQQVQGSSGGAIAPEISPDGRYLAFARRIPDGTISWKGHRYGPRNALWVRDLVTGRERVLADPIEVDMAQTFKALGCCLATHGPRTGAPSWCRAAGQLNRVDVATGSSSVIPFTAEVKRTISEMAWAPGRITDSAFNARFTRWHAASPDGRRLAFQAVGRIWIMDLPNGAPAVSRPRASIRSRSLPPGLRTEAGSRSPQWMIRRADTSGRSPRRAASR
jgi:hypothetical protein